MIESFKYSDIHQIIIKIPEWLADHPQYANYPVDPEHTSKFAESAQAVLQGQVILDNEEIVGLLLYAIGPTFFSPVIEANEMVFYIEPKYRTYRNACDLINKATEQAFNLGAARFSMGNSSGYRAKGVEKLYTRLGFYPSSGNYCKEA